MLNGEGREGGVGVTVRASADCVGLPNRPVKPLRVWLRPDHGPAPAALPFDLVWATTWEEEANEFIAPLLGLASLPFVPWPSPRPEPGNGVFWKTPEIVAWANGRAFAWPLGSRLGRLSEDDGE